MRSLLLAALTACSPPEAADYKESGTGFSAAAAVAQCEADRALPCGWVFWFDGPQIEFCIVWEDRIGPYPVKLRESAESLYGSSELSRDPRFGGTPICYYQCPSARGCNSTGGCFCLEGAP